MRVKVPVWRTAEGVELPIDGMADLHLLSAIHLIERQHLQKLTEVKERYQGLNFMDRNVYPDLVSYYRNSYPAAYPELLREADKRGLIDRVNILSLEDFQDEPIEVEPVVDEQSPFTFEQFEYLMKEAKRRKKSTNAKKKPRPQAKKKTSRKA
jgi:hypothetical protein